MYRLVSKKCFYKYVKILNKTPKDNNNPLLNAIQKICYNELDFDTKFLFNSLYRTNFELPFMVDFQTLSVEVTIIFYFYVLVATSSNQTRLESEIRRKIERVV